MRYITQLDIRNAIKESSLTKGHLIYGIPTGGWHIAYILERMGYGEVVYDIDEATLVVDDLVDSGRTRDQYMKGRNCEFFVPFDKIKNPELGWLVFDWENDAEKSIEDAVVRQLQFLGIEVNEDNIEKFTRKVKEIEL